MNATPPAASAHGAPGPRTLALCADDFGLGVATSSTILGLARRGRVCAVSCLSNSSDFEAMAPALRELPPGVEVGLHFNLTEGQALSAGLRARWPRLPPLGRLLCDAAMRRLPEDEIAAEWQWQWDALCRALGRHPDFVDGHQHVHQLPGVRQGWWNRLPPGAAVRQCGRIVGPAPLLKRNVLRLFGGSALQRALCQTGRPHNACLLGAYDFSATDYRALFRRWLAAAPARGGLLFCHPGACGLPDDAIGAARQREADYLGSPACAEDLAQAGVRLASSWVRSSIGG